MVVQAAASYLCGNTGGAGILLVVGGVNGSEYVYSGEAVRGGVEHSGPAVVCGFAVTAGEDLDDTIRERQDWVQQVVSGYYPEGLGGLRLIRRVLNSEEMPHGTVEVYWQLEVVL